MLWFTKNRSALLIHQRSRAPKAVGWMGMFGGTRFHNSSTRNCA